MNIYPNQIIVPILGLIKGTDKRHFLGTGSFCSANPAVIVTADHVIAEWEGPLAIVVLSSSISLFPAKVLHRRKETDIALLEVDNYHPPRVFTFAEDSEITTNTIITSLEYGTTVQSQQGIRFSPATRIGNVTRIFDQSAQFGEAGKDMMELSFPALRGASGSPIIDASHGFKLWGIVVANVNHHLLPAQIINVLDEKNEIYEETSFMLPQGLAVHVKHVRSIFNEVLKR